VIVLAGEDSNDRLVMRQLIEAVCPASQGRVVEVNDPVRIKDASPQTRSARIDHLVRLVRARAAREGAAIAYVFVHEDYDRPDSPSAQVLRESVQKELAGVVGSPASYVLAVAEIEAWLLLLPQSLSAFRASWGVPAKYRGSNTGLLTDPKRVLQREVSRDQGRYRESDAPGVIARAIASGEYRAVSGSNRSWSEFHAGIAECCRVLSALAS
jgi:hypothetical protein